MTEPRQPGAAVPPPRRGGLLQLPGLAAIGLYMMILAAEVIVGVAGGHLHQAYLLFAALFIAAGLGLLLLLRWAWALALAAMVLLAGMYLWQFTAHHAASSLVQGLLNLVFFLYLSRTEVRARLR